MNTPKYRLHLHRTFSCLTMAILLASLFLSMQKSIPVQANDYQPGLLDPSFGTGGFATTTHEIWSPAQDAVVQGDDKIVVVGGDYWYGHFILTRHHIDGSLDTTFGTRGKVTTYISGYARGYAVVLQPDDKIVVAGIASTDSINFDFALARYNTDGTLDTGFGTGGKVTTDFGGNDSGNAVALQSDGRIVVAGTSGTDFALARYNADGSLDTGFGTGGKVTTDFGDNDSGNAAALQSDGKIIVAGTNGTDFALARYNGNGSTDASFGTNGKVTTDFGGNDSGNAMALQSNGKIILAGTNGTDFAFVRYNTDGNLDTGFGTGGKVTTDFGGNDSGHAIALQSDGKLLLTGTNGTDFAFARYDTDGSLDTGFGPNGKVTTDFGGTDSGFALVLPSDGKIVVIGNSDTTGDGRDIVVIVAGYNSNGTLDTTFHSEVTTNFGDTSSTALGNAMALQSDGKIIVVGSAYFSSTYYDFALARYNSDGSLDTNFGTSGKVTTDFGGNDSGNAVALQSDGKIVVAGYTSGIDYGEDPRNFALARYNSDGSLDTSFGVSGKVITDFVSYSDYDYGNSMVLQSDGKIVVAGTSGFNFALARYNSNGNLDTSFGSSGKVTTDFGGSDNGKAMVLQSDGKIVVVGDSSRSSTYNIALARYNSNGSLDTGVVVDFGGSAEAELANAIALQSDGKIIVVGKAITLDYSGYHRCQLKYPRRVAK